MNEFIVITFCSYSEEIFSQQSRKMSGSSSLSEVELASDLIFTSPQPQPGPGGDTAPSSMDLLKLHSAKQEMQNLSKTNLIQLKNELLNLLDSFNKYEIENISKSDLSNLKLELAQFDLSALLKYNLITIKNELQNKYHAELEILREDYENRIDTLNVEHEIKHQSIERRYEEKIDALKYDLDEALKNAAISVSKAVEEVVSF